MISRRRLLITLGASSLTAPFGSFAQQQSKVWRVGFLSQRHVDFVDSDRYYGPFLQGMRELGYVEAKNLIIEWRSSEGNNERLPGLAIELANLNVDVIVTSGTPAARAAQKATTTIPIVVGGSGNPVGAGLVQSLARPGGNITGLSSMSAELRLKHFEMLLNMVPKLSRVAVMLNPSNSDHIKSLEVVQAAGQKRGITILRADARNPQEIETAFSLIVQQNAGALLLFTEGLFTQRRSQIAELTAKHRLPSITQNPDFAEAGILMSYGPSTADTFRRVTIYVDKIFKGTKPADLPVEQPTIFDLIINGKTAKALGIKIPNSILVQATKVIE